MEHFLIYSKPEAKVIADSISESGHRLTTIQAKIHRFVLAEINTHRAFSRCSASSRAVPAKKLRQQVIDDPAMPVFWGINRPGMQAVGEADGNERQSFMDRWLIARDAAVVQHRNLEREGLHKQLVNRIIEPWLWHHVIISATEWDNFFWQRCHPDAQPEMRAAAEAIYAAYSESRPDLILHGEWHLPYITEGELADPTISTYNLQAISTGRCARVSYLNHEGVRDLSADVALYGRLVKQSPGHWSPLENVATPDDTGSAVCGNFKGWAQLRGIVAPAIVPFVR